MKEGMRWACFIVFLWSISSAIYELVSYYRVMIPSSEYRHLAVAGVYALIAIATKPDDD